MRTADFIHEHNLFLSIFGAMKLSRALLMPFSLVYGLLAGLRNLFFDIGLLQSKAFKTPVISVGNLSTGGTGKTPHIEYLVKLLKEDYHVAVLSRGYGRKSRGFKLAGENSTAVEIGDEPLQVKRKNPDVAVAVCESRVRGIYRLLESPVRPQVILLDDAFQHRYVKPSLSILLTAYSRLYSNDFVLPSGNLREFPSGSSRADAIIVTKTPSILSPLDRRLLMEKLKPEPYQKVFFSYTSYARHLVSLETGLPSPEDKDYFFKNYAVLLITGLADPSNIEYYIRERAKNFRHISYPDHYIYTEKDIRQIKNLFDNIVGENKIIVTTEKDAMRLNSPDIKGLIDGLPLYYLPIEVKFHGGDGNEFNQYIFQHVRQN